MLDDEPLGRLFGVVIAEWAGSEGEFIPAKDFYRACLTAGLDMTGAEPERRSPTLRAASKSFGKMPTEQKYRALISLIRGMVERGPQRAERLNGLLANFGYAWDGANLVPAGVLDAAERQFLPPTSGEEISKAVGRLARGDETGAISSACGAVDLATGAVYEKNGLGDPGRIPFAAKVNTAAQRLGVFARMRDEFIAIGIEEKDANDASTHMEATINHAAQTLQILRKRMGDVHGSRPALKSTAYDCIKFASAICALFEGHV